MKTKTSLNHTATKTLLGEVKLILLYDCNVVAKEVVTIKLVAYLRGFFWKNSLFHSKRDFMVVDA